MKCSYCCQEKNIVFWDSLKFKSDPEHTTIRLCWGCAQQYCVMDEINAIKPKLLICPTCSSMYIARRIDSKKCGLCWSKVFHKSTINIPIEIENKKQSLFNYGFEVGV